MQQARWSRKNAKATSDIAKMLSVGSKQAQLLSKIGLGLCVRGAAAIAGFLISLVVARQLGAEQAGYYFLVFNLVMVLAAVSRVGLDNTVVRFTAVASGQPQSGQDGVSAVLFKSSLVSLLVSSFVAVSVWFSARFLAESFFNKPDLMPVLQNMAPGIVFLSLFTLFAMSLQGQGRATASVFTVNICVNLLLGGGFAVFAVSNAADAAVVYVYASFGTVLFGILILRRRVCVTWTSGSWRELFNSCLPLWLVVIMSQLSIYGAQFVAGVWLEGEDLAQLAVAQRVAMLMSSVLLVVNLVVAPMFADLYAKDSHAELQSLVRWCSRLLYIATIPLAIVFLGFAELIMGIFGDGFVEGDNVLRILVIGQLVNVIAGSVGMLLVMSGHEKAYRNIAIVTGPLSVVLALLLVPVFGVLGAANAAAIAMIVHNVLAVIAVKRRLAINTLVPF